MLEQAGDIPEDVEYLYRLFFDIRRGTPLSYTEIDAFQRVTGIRLEYWEVMVLLSMDTAVDMKQAEIIDGRRSKVKR